MIRLVFLFLVYLYPADGWIHTFMDGWVDHLSKVKLNGFSMLSIKSYEDYVSTFGKINEKKGMYERWA